jgi:hypothetical protein
VGDRFLIRGLWSQVLAHLVLHRSERRQFQSQNLPPVKAVAWLLEQIAAKEAIRSHAGAARPLADIDLRAAEPWHWIRTSCHGFTAAAVVAERSAFSGIGLALAPIEIGCDGMPWAVARSAACSAVATALGIESAACRSLECREADFVVVVDAGGSTLPVAVRRVRQVVVAVCVVPSVDPQSEGTHS